MGWPKLQDLSFNNISRIEGLETLTELTDLTLRQGEPIRKINLLLSSFFEVNISEPFGACLLNFFERVQLTSWVEGSSEGVVLEGTCIHMDMDCVFLSGKLSTSPALAK